MSQQIINVGAVANDGTGQSLRTAFEAVNNNFANIWAQGPVDSQVVITNNVISTNVSNSPLVLQANGIAEITVTSSVVPGIDSVFDLGSSSKQFDTIWSRYYVGQDGTFSRNLTVGGNLTVQGNIIQVGNIVTETLTIQLANAATTANAANGAGITVGANDDIATILYNSTSNVWNTNVGIKTGNIIIQGDNIMDLAGPNLTNGDLTHGSTSGLSLAPNGSANATTLYNTYGNVAIFASATGANVHTFSFGTNGNMSIPGNLSVVANVAANYFIGNGSQLTGLPAGYANSNAVAYGESGWAGNLIPNGNAVYSLGNSTHQWNDLYVSNATIYMNNVPISLTSGNVLTVNGDDVVTTNANGQIILGNLSVDDNNIYNTNGQGVVISNFSFIAEAETAYVQIPAGNSASDLSVVQEQGNVRIAAGGADWTFDTTGNLTIPNGGYINFVNTGGITQAVNEDLRFTVSDDEQDGWAVQSTVNDGAGNDLTRMQVMYDGVAINTDIPTNNYRWDFRDTGEFDVPKSIRGPVGGNLVISIGDQFGSTTFIDLQTRSYVGDALISNVRIANPDVTVSTASGAYNWTFGGTGNLTLPLSGNIVGATANNNGYLNWFGNSSGDGNGYTTMRLVPDDTLEGNDQYLIIDPTAPGHIHIRAGGTQDNSGSDLFLGGENSYFKVNAGANSQAQISANSHAWVFGADSILTVPGEGTIRSIGDSVTLQSYNVGTGNVQSVYLGSGGGLGFFDQDIGGNWLEIFRSGAEPQIRVPVGLGNLNIQTAQGNTAYDWVFDNTGNLTTPGNITVANVVTANTFVSNAFNVVTAGNLSITSQYGLGFTGTILEDNGTLELIANGGGAVVVGWDSTYGNGLGNIATVNFNEVGGEGILLRTGNRAATEYNWNFDNTGNLTLPGNTFSVNYANGTQVSLGGGSYGNADVSNFLANYGSNTIVTTGNITGNTAGFTIGYRDIPQVTFSANATAALADAGKHYYSTTAGNLALTIPDNANVALPTGATLTIVVNAAGNVLVNQAAGVTLYQAGSSTTGNRVVGAYGLASVMKVAANTWVISGTGVY